MLRNKEGLELAKHMTDVNLDIIKDVYGVEFIINQLNLLDLEKNGYKKMMPSEIVYIEPLFEIAPQFIADKVKYSAVQKAFKGATENSYKCILDPSKHLAIIKGTKDVYIGGALDNETNRVVGQARWLKNDTQLSVSDFPDIVLNVFNTLSIITGQYFISQVNSNLLDISLNISEIQTYLEDRAESELETAVQKLNEVYEHLKYIKKDFNRIRDTIIQLNNIETIAQNTINLCRKQIERVMKNANFSDREKLIIEHLNKIKRYLMQYHLAVYIYNTAHVLKIYLSNITDLEELILYRNELSDVIEQYKKSFKEAIEWSEMYLDKANVLNKVSKKQIITMFFVTVPIVTLTGKKHITYDSANKVISLVNDLFEKNRDKKKDAVSLSHEEYKEYMNSIFKVESSLSTIDNYIKDLQRTVEIILCDGNYYIKYLEKED